MRRFLIIVALVSVCLGGAWLARIPIAQSVAEKLADAYAPLPVEFTIDSLDHRGFQISGIRAGSDNPILIDQVAVRFSIGGLLSHRISAIDSSGISLPVIVHADSVTIGDLKAGQDDDDSVIALPNWTVDGISMRDFEADIDIPGVASLSLQADVETTGPLSSTQIQSQDTRHVLSLIDLKGRLQVTTATDAGTALGIPQLSTVQATGAATFTAASGLIDLQTPVPLNLTSPYGTTTVQISLSGDANSADPLKAVTGSATISVDLADYPLPDQTEATATIKGNSTIALSAGAIDLTIDKTMVARLSAWPVELATLPDALSWVSGPVDISVTEALTLSTHLDALDSGSLPFLAGTGRVDAKSGPFTATITGPFNFQVMGNSNTIDVAEIQVHSDGFDYDGMDVTAGIVLRDGKIDLQSQALDAALVANIDVVTGDDASAYASAAGRLRLTPSRLIWEPSQGGHVKAGSGDITVDAELKSTGANRIDIALDDETSVKPSVLGFAHTRISFGDTQVDLDDVESEFVFSPKEVLLTLTSAPVHVNNAEMLAGPVRLEATVKRQENGTLIDGVMTTEPGLSASFNAFHTEKVPVIHTVIATVDVDPLTFEEGGLQPSDVFPFLILSGPIDGVLATTMAVTVDPDKPLKGLITSTIKDAGFRNPVFAIGGVNAEIRLPIETLPASQPDQTASGHVSFGPLQQAPFTLHYETGQDMAVLIDTLVIDGFGGRFGVKQVGINPDGTEATGIIFLDAVDFDVLTRVADIEGFSADGVLSGDVPFAIIGNRLIAPKGQLRALGSGHLTYTSPELDAAALSDPQMALLVEALRDFQYKALSLDLEMPADSDGSLLLNLQGNNANVLDGHPFNINVNLESDFNKLSNDLYKIYEQATDFVSASSQ